MFIPDFISRIKFKPSSVRWEPSVINFATLHQSRESNSFTPSSGFFSKKGIIILIMSEKLNIVKTTAGFPGYSYNFPEPRYQIKYSISFLSLSC